MNISLKNPVDIGRLEKAFGPYIPGKGTQSTTVSAIRAETKGKAKGTFVAVLGIFPEAHFYVQFPQSISLAAFASKSKGVLKEADSIKGLRMDGPQGNQGRITEFEAWRTSKSWETELQRLSGDFPCVIEIPGLNRRFQAVLQITASGKTKKIALKGGKLSPA